LPFLFEKRRAGISCYSANLSREIYAGGATRKYHPRPAQQITEQTIISPVVTVFSRRVIADQSLLWFLSAYPISKPIAVPLMAPSEITIRTEMVLIFITFL
jgi:hypothetical protein